MYTKKLIFYLYGDIIKFDFQMIRNYNETYHIPVLLALENFKI